ncbi:hypothetical protein HK104_006576 [Borealophlyctis nickersoniae]|nr:hypothetical protein HK104_006576 [Borealophlyctis nickersoniae]
MPSPEPPAKRRKTTTPTLYTTTTSPPNVSPACPSATPFPRRIAAGTGFVTVTEMTSTCPQSPPSVLRNRLQQDGYLLLRNFLPSDLVLEARRKVVRDLEEGGFLMDGSECMDAVMHPSCWRDGKEGVDGQGEGNRAPPRTPDLLERQDLATSPEVKAVLEHESLFRLFEVLYSDDDADANNEAVDDSEDEDDDDDADHGSTVSESFTDEAELHQTDQPIPSHTPTVLTLPYKWLRAVPTGLYTGPHMDRVYLGHLPHLLTAWTPIGACPTLLGALVVCPQSHRSRELKSLREGYGRTKVGKDGTASGWVCDDPEEIMGVVEDEDEDEGVGEEVCSAEQSEDGVKSREAEAEEAASTKRRTVPLSWVSADFEPGDICIIDVDTLHMSATNVTRTWRITCDTRWMPWEGVSLNK